MNAADLLLAELPDGFDAWRGAPECLYQRDWPAASEYLRRKPDGAFVLRVASYVYPGGTPHPFDEVIEEEIRPQLERRIVQFEITREQAAHWLLGRALPPDFWDLFKLRP